MTTNNFEYYINFRPIYEKWTYIFLYVFLISIKAIEMYSYDIIMLLKKDLRVLSDMVLLTNLFRWIITFLCKTHTTLLALIDLYRYDNLSQTYEQHSGSILSLFAVIYQGNIINHLLYYIIFHY